jgi:hypothetical protein
VAVIGAGERARQLEQLLLHARDLLDRQLDTEVPARDHHAVGCAQDLLRAVDRLGLLDLRDQRHARVAPNEGHVVGASHERQGDHVHPDRLAVAQHREVLLGHRRQRVGRPGDVEPLARGDGAADLDLGVDLV